MAEPLIEPTTTPLDDLTFRERRFIEKYLSDGRFCVADAVRYAYPDTPPEKIGVRGNAVRRRPRVRAAIAYLCNESMETLKERLEYTIGRALLLQAMFNPFEIIDKNGFIRPDVDVGKLGEAAQLIKGIDTKTGKVQFVDRQKALDSLMTFAGLSKEADPKNVHNHLHIYLPGKKDQNEWNQLAQE